MIDFRSTPFLRPQPSVDTGTYPAYVPVPRVFWPAFALVNGAVALDAPLTGNLFLAAAAVLMIIGGLPHGAFDIAIAQQAFRLRPSYAAALILAYLGVAMSMILLWSVAPVTTLCLFLALSAVHFGQDWKMLDSGFLRAAAGASVLCIPAFFQTQAVTDLFVAMAGLEADWVRRVMVAFTPVVLLVTSVGMLLAIRAGNASWAIAQFAALAALAYLPPQAAFLLFFVFLHSPLHMRGVVAALPRWSTGKFWCCGGLTCLACITGAVLLAPGLLSGQSLEMSAESFRLLSVVAAPHLLLTLLVDRRKHSLNSWTAETRRPVCAEQGVAPMTSMNELRQFPVMDRQQG